MTTEDDLVRSNVMGIRAVLVTSSLLFMAALAQLVGLPGSKVLGQFGGFEMDLAWSACLIIAEVILVSSRLVAADADGAILELGGIALLVAGIGTYVVALFASPDGLTGRLVLLAFCLAAIINLTGRAWLTGRRLAWVRRIHR